MLKEFLALRDWSGRLRNVGRWRYSFSPSVLERISRWRICAGWLARVVGDPDVGSHAVKVFVCQANKGEGVMR